MKAFFRDDERVKRLDLTAQGWVGTPFRNGSRMRGVGANCVGAVAGVLIEAGFAVPEYPQVATRWARDHTESAMAAWLDKQECFAAVEDAGLISPGDVVGLQAGRCIHHLCLILPGGRFLQCSEGMGVTILSQAERQFVKRLARAWRPIEI